jgi:uncharacterized protein DUF3667
MHHPEGDITCPNCGFVYEKSFNYCPRCGQQSHLHNETLGALIMHFIGHYFHYDSKAWQTLKALWFRPGKLTIAYWSKQRMRYIPPISLYIFISAVFFLVSSLMPGHYLDVQETNNKNDTAIHAGTHFNVTKESKGIIHITHNNVDKSGDAKINNKSIEEIFDRFAHMIPKVFFFMIPFMAFILKLFFVRRKDLLYVNHIIYALHYHAFFFSVALLVALNPFEQGTQILAGIILSISAAYFIISLRKVYNITWVRSVVYSLVMGLFYVIFILVGLSIIFVTAI